LLLLEAGEKGQAMDRPAGIILAGGAATRIGGEKALMSFRSGTLLDAVIARVECQVALLALNIRAEDAPAVLEKHGTYPLVFDSLAEGTGPLGGVIAGLAWLSTQPGSRWLATFPCDTPFLPLDLVDQLMAHTHERPVFAHDARRMHGICAIWPVGCAASLRAGVEQGALRSVQSALKALGGETCQITAGEHAFFNVNTREDLAMAERLAPSCR
jgi:molybdopterin-guanine dinucleotide biosynthesis protein A